MVNTWHWLSSVCLQAGCASPYLCPLQCLLQKRHLGGKRYIGSSLTALLGCQALPRQSPASAAPSEAPPGFMLFPQHADNSGPLHLLRTSSRASRKELKVTPRPLCLLTPYPACPVTDLPANRTPSLLVCSQDTSPGIPTPQMLPPLACGGGSPAGPSQVLWPPVS